MTARERHVSEKELRHSYVSIRKRLVDSKIENHSAMAETRGDLEELEFDQDVYGRILERGRGFFAKLSAGALTTVLAAIGLGLRGPAPEIALWIGGAAVVILVLGISATVSIGVLECFLDFRFAKAKIELRKELLMLEAEKKMVSSRLDMIDQFRDELPQGD